MIYVFAHTKGGVGKSTLAWHFLMLLKSLGFKVKVIDLDFQQTLFFVNEIRKAAELDGVEVVQPSSSAELIEIYETKQEDEVYIVDIGGFDTDINRTAMIHADQLIVPISNSTTEVIGFKTFEQIIEETDIEKIDVVLNNIHGNTKNFDMITNAIGNNPKINLLDQVVRRNKDYDRLMGYGKSIFDTDLVDLQEQIKGLYNELRRN